MQSPGVVRTEGRTLQAIAPLRDRAWTAVNHHASGELITTFQASWHPGLQLEGPLRFLEEGLLELRHVDSNHGPSDYRNPAPSLGYTCGLDYAIVYERRSLVVSTASPFPGCASALSSAGDSQIFGVLHQTSRPGAAYLTVTRSTD